MGRKNKNTRKDKPSPQADDASTVEAAAAPPPEARVTLTDGPGRFQLEALVLVAGAVLMGLEIAGSRVLAPHFGNSVFVWGSLISVFLTSLSVGYFAGGRLADKVPSWVLLNVLLIGSGLLILLVPYLAHPLCRAMLAAGWQDRSGPLVASVLLFLPASVLMGMVSPFSVRLATETVRSVGRTAGGLYALSTMGSIAGTLLTTFVLIPSVGVSAILKGLGGTLLVMPMLLLLLRMRGLPAVVLGFMLGLIALTNPTPAAWPVPDYATVVLEEDTPYHHITVADDKLRNVRDLRFDRYVESSIKLFEPYESQAKYTDYFHLAFLLQPELKSAVFIGAGGGIGPRTFREVDPTLEIDVVDIDQRILEIAAEHFFMPTDEGIHPVAADGRVFLYQTEKSYDALFLDAFTIGGRIPFHMTTREYFELCQSKLNANGVFVMNINSALEGENSAIFRAVGATLLQVFPHVYAFAKDGALDPSPTRSRNVILVGSQSETALKPDDWRARVKDYPGSKTIGPYRMGSLVEDLVHPFPDLSDAVPFSDDYAPIETMRF